MDTDTGVLIDKIKRNAKITYTVDDDIALMIGDTFDKISADTGLTNLYFDDMTDYKIMPEETFLGPVNSDVREAIFLCVVLNQSELNSELAQGKAVIVRSGRDMVDTTKSAKGLDTLYERRLKKYVAICNRIMERIGGGAAANISEPRLPFGYPNNAIDPVILR